MKRCVVCSAPLAQRAIERDSEYAIRKHCGVDCYTSRAAATIGSLHGRWTVVGNVDSKHVICRCGCGHEKKIHKGVLLSGGTTECRACYLGKTVKPIDVFGVGLSAGEVASILEVDGAIIQRRLKHGDRLLRLPTGRYATLSQGRLRKSQIAKTRRNSFEWRGIRRVQ